MQIRLSSSVSFQNEMYSIFQEKTVDEIPALKTLSSNGLCIKDNALSLLQWVLDRCSFSIKTLKASHVSLTVKPVLTDTCVKRTTFF